VSQLAAIAHDAERLADQPPPSLDIACVARVAERLTMLGHERHDHELAELARILAAAIHEPPVTPTCRNCAKPLAAETVTLAWGVLFCSPECVTDIATA